jgi:hypothetical protein
VKYTKKLAENLLRMDNDYSSNNNNQTEESYLAGDTQRGLFEVALMEAAARAGYRKENYNTNPMVYDAFCNGYRIGLLTAANPAEAGRQLKEAYKIPDQCERQAFIRGHEAGALDTHHFQGGQGGQGQGGQGGQGDHGGTGPSSAALRGIRDSGGL